MMESKFVWGGLDHNLNTALPFLVKLDVLNEHDEPLTDYTEAITITAVANNICLREGFENKGLGLWYAAPRLATAPAVASPKRPPTSFLQDAGIPAWPLRARLRQRGVRAWLVQQPLSQGRQ